MKNLSQPSNRLFLLASFFAALLAGCTFAAQAPDEATEPASAKSFASHVETVFRRQNEAGNQAIFLLVDESANGTPALVDAVSAAERRMLDECAPLNAYASQYSAHQEVGLGLKLSIVNSVAACDDATQTLEGLLRKIRTPEF